MYRNYQGAKLGYILTPVHTFVKEKMEEWQGTKKGHCPLLYNLVAVLVIAFQCYVLPQKNKEK